MISDEQLIKNYRGGDAKARDTLAERYFKYVFKAANRYRKLPSGVTPDDIVSYGFECVLNCIDAWEESRGVMFVSYLDSKIDFAFASGLREETGSRTQYRNHSRTKTFSQLSPDEDEETPEKSEVVDLETPILNEQIWRTVINKSRSAWDKQLLHCYYNYGFSMVAIAKRFGFTAAFICQEIHAAVEATAKRVEFKYSRRRRKNRCAIPKCIVDGCDEPYLRSGLCQIHKTRWDLYRQLGLAGMKVTEKSRAKVCHYNGCKEKHYRDHLCYDHWVERKRETGDLKKCDTEFCDFWVTLKVKFCTKCYDISYARAARAKPTYVPKKRPKKEGVCSLEGCSRVIYAGGKCQVHRREERAISGNFKTCSVEGCSKMHFARGLCDYHWNKQRYEKLKMSKELVVNGPTKAADMTITLHGHQ
jgi:RNA polymerase sigma factor (sigma-70 family)